MLSDHRNFRPCAQLWKEHISTSAHRLRLWGWGTIDFHRSSGHWQYLYNPFPTKIPQCESPKWNKNNRYNMVQYKTRVLFGVYWIFEGWPSLFGVTHDFTYDLTHPESFNPFVTMGHHGSPWVTVGHRASSCPAFCVLCNARPPADVQKLLGHLWKFRDLEPGAGYKYHMWVMSTIANLDSDQLY